MANAEREPALPVEGGLTCRVTVGARLCKLTREVAAAAAAAEAAGGWGKGPMGAVVLKTPLACTS